jgi:hypothetical protein
MIQFKVEGPGNPIRNTLNNLLVYQLSNKSTKCDHNVNTSYMDKERRPECYQDNSTVPVKHHSNTMPTASIRDSALWTSYY